MSVFTKNYKGRNETSKLVDGRLVDMEEASLEAEVSKDDATGDSTFDVQEEERHDSWTYLFLSLFIHVDALL